MPPPPLPPATLLAPLTPLATPPLPLISLVRLLPLPPLGTAATPPAEAAPAVPPADEPQSRLAEQSARVHASGVECDARGRYADQQCSREFRVGESQHAAAPSTSRTSFEIAKIARENRDCAANRNRRLEAKNAKNRPLLATRGWRCGLLSLPSGEP
jgi:hypothetical protein